MTKRHDPELKMKIAFLFVQFFNEYMSAPTLKKSTVRADKYANRALDIVQKHIVGKYEVHKL